MSVLQTIGCSEHNAMPVSVSMRWDYGIEEGAKRFTPVLLVDMTDRFCSQTLSNLYMAT